MANNILIRGEAAIGQANQFVDYGKVIGKRLNIDSLIAQRRQKENQFITDVKNMPDFDYQILSDNMRDPITNALVQTKQSYINSARTLRDYSPNSQQYVDAVNQMNSAKRQFESMDGFVKLYNAGKIDYKESLADMSEGNHNKDRAFLAEIYNPNFKNITVENGEIFFNTEAAGKVSIKNLPDYFNKDGKTMGEIETLYDTAYKGAAKGVEYDENRVLMGLNRIFANAGNEGKRSIAFDYGIPSLDPDQPQDITFSSSARFKQLNDAYEGDYDTWAHDPANDKLLGQEINNWLRGAFKTSISKKYDSWKKERDLMLNLRYGGRGRDAQETPSNLIDSMRQNSLVADITTAPFGYDSYEQFMNDPKFKNDKERNAYLVENRVREVESFDIEQSNKNYANRLSVLLNSPIYGSQNVNYLTKDQLIAKVLENKDEFENRGIKSAKDKEGAEAFVNKFYGAGYLYSEDTTFATATIQSIPINVFEDDPYIEALIKGGGAIDKDL